ncbi:2391_t:CDS:2, partial [Gigaspora rosea]
MGERLGKEVLYSRSEIKKNISQLEDPSSYDNYINALPNIICSFFKALLTVLQQYKLTIVNNKRRQHYEFTDQPLFGESLTTENLLIMYETTLNALLETRTNEFKMEDMLSEIAEQVPIGCNIPPPNIVILEPGDPPNCNENVHAACEMYQYIDDVVISQNSRAIKSRKDSLWSLATKLLSAFDHPDPTTHFLFEDAPEISKKGIENILSFYETGTSRFQRVLAQDVYKTETPTPGRRVRNINAYTYAKLESMKKQKNSQVNNPTQVQE